MKAQTTSSAVDTLRILADPTRFKIVTLLVRAHQKKEDLCVKDIAEAIGISHSAASHQLAKLEDKGIVGSCRAGQTICYCMKSTAKTKLITKVIKIVT